MKVHEVTRSDGSLAPVYVSVDDGAIAIESDEGIFPLPEGALEAVMSRFGRPLESGERLVEVSSVDLGGGCVLRHVRHLARYDVIARDYLVYSREGAEPTCALATTVAGALAHLGRAARAG